MFRIINKRSLALKVCQFAGGAIVTGAETVILDMGQVNL